MADGNFKADHVRQRDNNDVWLSEGGGMMSSRREYDEFLVTAKEQSTVSNVYISLAGGIDLIVTSCGRRGLPVKDISEQSKWP